MENTKNSTTQQIVTLQIEAYNNRDLEANMRLFSDTIKIINFSDDRVLIDGKAACRKMYEDLFANSPTLLAEVINRIDFDNKSIVHETVFGRNGSDEKLEQLIIFEICNEKIERIFKL